MPRSPPNENLDGVAAQTLFEAIATEAVRRHREFNAQELANTIWAFACLGWQQSQIFWELGSALMERFDDLNDAWKSDLYLVTLYVRMECPDLKFPFSSRVESLRSPYTRLEPRPSQFQRDVSATLTGMGWNHEFEHVTREGVSLDLADHVWQLSLACHSTRTSPRSAMPPPTS